ncbi:MAG TPA: cyclic nucleotide-binding domain-containing protein, partial [Lachnospiraceae bacterium]|nr:cyclic nucleotide-binding domain-containing protein [Lachnospiraceae bacterium]
KKKSMRMTVQQEKSYLEDPMRKLNYEIINMFQYNNRLVNGQIAAFVPILHSDIFVKDLSSTFVTAAKVNYTINQLREIDYSIFYRETLYFDKEKKIEKEYIQKEVFPDIILLPTSGVNGVMWQEIEGKKRDTSGRFLLPSFAEVELEDMLIKVFGRFHWELCRSIQGTAWNNIKYKSLTSEYVDYIQFYKKNRDLSTETKERIKLQIQKGKSNSREIFVIDYVNWIKNESKGSIRLNKYVREILAMYCPFGKKTRVRLASQPLFDEAMARFNRENMKKIRELELRYKALEKEGIALTKELIDTSTFYNEM